MSERFFIPQPAAVRATCADTGPRPEDEATLGLYREPSGTDLKWSGRHPLPSIGERIHVHMNSIGNAVVHGYFESEGFLGVMAKPTRPPAWLRQRIAKDRDSPAIPQWRRDGVACFFGTEIEPRARRRKAVRS